MARRVVSQAEQARAAFDALTTKVARAAASPAARSHRAFERARGEVQVMLANHQTGGFDQAELVHVVALHALLHHGILGVEDAEMRDAFLGAVSAAKKLCRDCFKDDVQAVLAYVRWAWGREKRREAKRRADDNTDGGRLGWRWVFVARGLVTDYRVAQHRSVQTR